ncbi:hypothetical protein Ac2012v2_002402 [Leucoagaricus gongylophorus]
MKAVLLPLVFVAGTFAQGQLTINTPPNVVQCQPVLLTWSGGQVRNSVLPGNDPTGQALVDFGQQNGTSVSWLVNQQANTALGLTLRDSIGQVAQSASFTVNPGSSSGCLSQTVSFSGGTGAAPAPAAPATTGGATTSSVTNPAAATGAVSTNAASTNAASTGVASGTSSQAATSAGSSAGSSATSSSAASANFAGVSTAGVIGAIFAVFFA